MQSYTKQVRVAQREVVKIQVALDRAKVIKNEEDLKKATEFLIKVKSVSKIVSGQKTPIVKSLNDALREVRGLFRPAEDRLLEAEMQVKAVILDYNEKVEQKALRESQKIEKKVDDGKMDISTGMGKLSKIEQGSQTIQTPSGSAQFRTIRKVRITDISKLSSYMIRMSVQEAIKMEITRDVKNGLPVPVGAEFYEEKIVAGVGG